MSFAVKNLKTKEVFDCGRSFWYDLLCVAESFGWEPEGTVLQDHPNWDGNYTSNDFQVITPSDGKQLASALRRAAKEADGRPNIKFAPAMLEEMATFVCEGEVATR